MCTFFARLWLSFIVECRNDAARLWRNVKQAEGNTLHLLPFAFHACLIKNDFYATDLSLSVSLDVLEIMARIAVFDVRPQMTVDLRLNRGKRKYSHSQN